MTFAAFGMEDSARVLDVQLRELTEWTGWGYDRAVVSDGVLYAVWYGGMYSAPVRTGPKQTLRKFEFEQNFLFEIVPRPSVAAATPAPSPHEPVRDGGASSTGRARPIIADGECGSRRPPPHSW